MADGDLYLSDSPNVDEGFVEQDGGLRRVVLTAIPEGTLQLSDSANISTGYVTDEDGKKHKVNLIAEVEGTLELSDNPAIDTAYVVDGDGKKHKVQLTATLAGGGAPINNQDISVTANGEYTAEEGYTGLGTVTVNVPNPSTGTKSITTNGVYDVTTFASADVQVPTTAPDYYIDFSKDANDTLQSSSTLMSFSGLKDFGNNVLQYKYYNNTSITGSVDLSDVTKISGNYALSNAFYGCTGITGVDLTNLTEVSGNSGLESAFQGCTSISSVDLSKLEKLTGTNALKSMFSGCTGITTADLSKIESISASNALQSIFNGCTGLASVNLNSLKYCTDYGLNSAFYGCTGLTNIDLSNILSDHGWSGYTFQNMLYGCSHLTSANLSGLVYLKNTSTAANIMQNCTSLTSHSFDKLALIQGTSAFSYGFRGCTSLSSLSFPAVLTISNNNAFQNMLYGVTGCILHFPSNMQSRISTMTGYPNFGGTSTSCLFDLSSSVNVDLSHIKTLDSTMFNFYRLFRNNTDIVSINMSNLETIENIPSIGGAESVCEGCTNLTSFDLSKLRRIGGTKSFIRGFQSTAITSANLSNLETIVGESDNVYCMFNNCSNLTSVNIDKLVYGNCESLFQGCTGLTTVKLNSYKNSSGQQLTNFFSGDTSLTDVYFPAIKNVTTNSFNYFMSNTTGVTLHFPTNMQATISALPTYPNFYGTNNTCVFDLPSVLTLTGANSVQYERSPKDDTSSALAWRVLDGGTMSDPVIDWTPYYTSGTTDPTTGTTIYSDAACTTAVTTISSIA